MCSSFHVFDSIRIVLETGLNVTVISFHLLCRVAARIDFLMILTLPFGFRLQNRFLDLWALFLLLGSSICLHAGPSAPLAISSSNPLPDLNAALASRQDVWGLAAMSQSNGPSYEFFKNLLPPLRYVNADFRYYPIILSAPDSSQKARLVSNGSVLNPRAVLKTWKESGVPVSFFVGENEKVFGADLRRLKGPNYVKGYLPIVQFVYEDEGASYEEEVFASVTPDLAAYGVVFARFNNVAQGNGKISVHIQSATPLKEMKHALCNAEAKALVWFDDQWQWDESKQILSTKLARRQPAFLAIASKPVPNVPKDPADSLKISAREYEHEKAQCVSKWRGFLDRGMQLEVPEPVVNNAWRSLLIGNQIMVEGDAANYSWGNAYERLYEAECGDAVRAFLLWGWGGEARRMMPPLLDYTRDKLEFHNAGFKLQTLAHYYWLTRDAEFVKSMRARWERDVKRIAEGREPQSGLAPRENYCGDIATPIYSLNANANGWRGLRDMAAVLDDVGEHEEAQRLAGVAADYRQKILAAADKSEWRDVHPSFMPIALFGAEKPVDPLTATRLGSYWCLMAPYVLGSGVLGSGQERATVDYLQERGGVFMGMIRFDQHSGLFANENGVDDLYGLRYANTLLRLDEPDRALVSFYGKLAQGMTQDTFISAEGTGLKPLDEFGRPMYLPPNNAANANFLWTLRYLLVQDWDMDDDGKPDTLRLLFATPRSWLRDGQTIKMSHAPTAFGEVSVTVKSRLKLGEVIAEIQPPQRESPRETLLRIRLPDGWRPTSANIIKSTEHLRTSSLPLDENDTLKLPQLKTKFTVRVKASQSAPVR